MGLILGGVSARDLILDGQSVSLYVGGNPPMKVWPTTDVVQITLGTGLEARDQFRAALADRGLDYRTVTEIPFDIELVGSGSAQTMFQACSALTTVPAMDTSNVTNMAATFYGCTALTTVPAMDTSNVTNMSNMFQACSALTTVPAMDTSNVTNMYGMFIDCSSLTTVPDMDTRNVTYTGWMFQACSALTNAPNLDTRNVTSTDGMFWNCSSLTTVPDMDAGNITSTYGMFWGCSALTDGKVRLIGKHPEVFTGDMITDSGLTREPWYTAGGAPIDVYEVSFYGEYGRRKLVPLVSVTIPAGEVWAVRVQGKFTRTTTLAASKPQIRIGTATSGTYSQGEVVDFSGTVSSSDSTIAAVMNRNNSGDLTDFVGTVTIERVVQITLGTGYQAQDQFRAALTARGLNYQTVTEIPFGIELVGTGSAQNMFYGCSALTRVPNMDTSQVTNMTAMFNGCKALTHAPDMDTSKVTNMLNMFYNCSSLTSVPAMDTSQVTNMTYMFYFCRSLTHAPDMDTSQVTNMSGMFRSCSALTSVPDMDTSRVTNINYMFHYCSSLTDGNVRLSGRNPKVTTESTITGSGLTRLPFYDTFGNPI